MTSPADAAAELKRALSQSKSDEICGLYKEFADLCGIPPNVVNQLTQSNFSDFLQVKRDWMPKFSSITKLIESILESLEKIEEKDESQKLLYIEIGTLQNVFVFFESCDTRAKMLQFVRVFSALPLVESAMTEFALDEGRKAGASASKLVRIRNKKRVFGGILTPWHQFRRKQPWDDGSKFTLNLGALRNQINMMAKWANVQLDKNQDVKDLNFKLRLENLREDPLKLTGYELLVQTFMDEAARNFLATLLPAGTTPCRRA
jgi:hypothetical protein